MTVLLVSSLKIADPLRARQLHDCFAALCPADAVILAWDHSAMPLTGEDKTAQMSILAFRDPDRLQRFLNSPEYAQLATLRAAAGEADMRIVNSAMPFDLLACAAAA